MKRWRFIPIISPSKITILLNIPRNISESFLCHVSCIPHGPCTIPMSILRSRLVNPIEIPTRTVAEDVRFVRGGASGGCDPTLQHQVVAGYLQSQPLSDENRGMSCAEKRLIYPLTNIAMV